MSQFQLKAKSRTHALQSQTAKIIEQLQSTVSPSQFFTPKNAKLMLSTESLSQEDYMGLNETGQEVSVALESIAKEVYDGVKPTSAQLAAGSIAGFLAGNMFGTLSTKQEFPTLSTESMGIIMPMGGSDSFSERAFGLEAYDERENKNAAFYSMAYNMQAARQGEVGETFFPTIVLNPDEVGFAITVPLMMVLNTVIRNTSGSVTPFNKINVIRAVADSTILQHDSTSVIPVNRPQSVANFVNPDLVPPTAVLLEGESIMTAPLAVGKKIDILGISQTDTLLASGVMDQTDTLDPTITLKNVYLTFSDGTHTDVIRVNTTNLPYANFTYNPQNNYRSMLLAFSTTSVMINAKTVQSNGSPLVALAPIVAANAVVRLSLEMSGNVNIELGDTGVYANLAHTFSVTDSSGSVLDMTTGVGLTLSTLTNSAVIFGYDLKAYRTNMNRRQRGQLVDVTKWTQLYNVPLRCPITTLHPINTDNTTDSTDVQTLTVLTRIRTDNEAITAILSADQFLSQYVSSGDISGTYPDILGVGRFFVIPTYFTETMDMSVVVQSLTSSDRAATTRDAIVNKVRQYVFQMYRDSQYKAGADVLAGGVAPTPEVIIVTDPIIAGYFNVLGDLRTLGAEFNFRVVGSLDYRMRNRCIFTFGVFDESRNTTPHPLNFGNLIWAPELVLTANISRNGSISKETVVQPRFQFITHLPVMTSLTINNIPDITNKLPINFHSV